LASLPHAESVDHATLMPIKGSAPTAQRRPSGCAFHPRCPFAVDACAVLVPKLARVHARSPHDLACPVDPLVRIA
jgi:oligopeptide/dipeptide ABC transporter ATP-binding protein